MQSRYHGSVGRVEPIGNDDVLCLCLRGWELGLLSDFVIDVDDLELLQAIITDACGELRVSPDHQEFVARIVSLHSQGHTRKEILKRLRMEFGKRPRRGRKYPPGYSCGL